MKQQCPRYSLAVAVLQKRSTLGGIFFRDEMLNLLRDLEDFADWTEQELQDLLDAADVHGDGKLRYAEFVDWLLPDRACRADEAEESAGENDCASHSKDCEEPQDCDTSAPQADGSEQAETVSQEEEEEDDGPVVEPTPLMLVEAIVDSMPLGPAGLASAEDVAVLMSVLAEGGDAAESAQDMSPAALAEAIMSAGTNEDLIFPYWKAHSQQIKAQGNLALGQHVQASSSYADWCGPGLMITGRGCDEKKWIAHGSKEYTVRLDFMQPVTVESVFIVWGGHTRMTDLAMFVELESGAEAAVCDVGTAANWRSMPPSVAPDGLSVTFVRPAGGAALEQVKSLLVVIRAKATHWVSIADLVVRGRAATVPFALPHLSECDCMEDLEVLRRGSPVEYFSEPGETQATSAMSLSSKCVLLSDGVAAVDAINARCAEAGSVFVDADFPSGEAAIVGPDVETTATESGAEIQWRRAVASPGVDLFVGGIDMNDVQQASSEYCWLAAAISSLACSPEHVKNLIYPQERNPYGAYAVRLFSPTASEWLWVVVDDIIPLGHDGRPYFMSAHDPAELWPVVLEKAFAKVHSCYRGLHPNVACSGSLAMTMLSGVAEVTSWVGKEFEGSPPESTPHGVDEVWETMSSAVFAGYAPACTVAVEEYGKHSDAELAALGVVTNYVYSCVGAFQLEDNTRLLRLRNPWGQDGDWNGPWSDGSDEWTEERRAEVPEYTEGNDGTFFISLEDFYEYWYRLDICWVAPTVAPVDLLKGKQ